MSYSLYSVCCAGGTLGIAIRMARRVAQYTGEIRNGV